MFFCGDGRITAGHFSLLHPLRREGRLLVLTGAFHAQLDAHKAETMANHLARAIPGLRPAMIEYARGACWSRGQLHELGAPVPSAPITLRVERGTPAVVPGRGA